MTNPKKLLVIAGGNYIFGAEKVTLDVIEGFSKNGYEVNAIISGWGNGAFAKVLDNLQIKYHKLKLGWYYVSKILWSLDSLVHYPGAILKFLRIRKNYKDWPVYIISFRQVILLWPFFEKNIIYHIHDVNSNSRRSRFFIKIINRKVSRFIAVSNFIKRDLILCGIGADKIEVIHNGIALPEKVGAPKKYMQENILHIGIVGQVIPRKGHEDIIEAINKIQKEVNLRLYIFGDGSKEFKKELEQKISGYNLTKRVEWMGFFETRERIYEQLDLLVAPTRNDEPFALVALEAGAFSIPSIVTKSGGFPESINDGETGYVIEKENVEQLAEKIALFFKQPFLLEQMGLLARKRVFEKFNVVEMNKKLINIIENN